MLPKGSLYTYFLSVRSGIKDGMASQVSQANCRIVGTSGASLVMDSESELFTLKFNETNVYVYAIRTIFYVLKMICKCLSSILYFHINSILDSG